MARNVTSIEEAKKKPVDITDSSKLLWHRFYGPMQSAAQQFNNAVVNTQNLLAELILEKEGYSKDTHVFDMDNLVIVERPKADTSKG